MKLWKAIRPVLAGYKKALFNRPSGLRHLGKGASLQRPWRLEGNQYIEIGARSTIMHGCNICAVWRYNDKFYTPSLSIGDDVYIGHYAFLTAITKISIGDGCVLSEHVYVTDFFHGLDPEKGLIMQQALESKGPVEIGSNCFLGYRASVMPGVTLGDWCIVGANSVVTRSFPAYSMIAGAPGQLIKVYSHALQQWVKPPSEGDRNSK